MSTGIPTGLPQRACTDCFGYVLVYPLQSTFSKLREDITLALFMRHERAELAMHLCYKRAKDIYFYYVR
jgi:hypothetical protein